MTTAAAGGAVTTALLLASGAVEMRETATSGGPPVAGRGLLVGGAPGHAGPSAREIYARAAPAVVTVRARTLRREPTPFTTGRPPAGRSAGSGFVLDAERGLIVCNAHTVAAAAEIHVELPDGQTVPARALGRDDDTDLALLAVDPAGLDLQALPLAETAAVEVGEPTLALGNGDGGEPTLSSGVVSAPRTRLAADSGFAVDGVIRTDAPQAPGETGGPLLDAEGRVVGVTGHLPVGGDLVGFAVPAETVAQVVPQLEETGRVRRAFLGIRPEDAGGHVGVGSVRAGSPAAAAGLRRGDTVRAIAGRRVRSVDELCRVLAARRPGAEVALSIARGTEPMTLRVRLADRPDGVADR